MPCPICNSLDNDICEHCLEVADRWYEEIRRAEEEDENGNH